MSVPGATSFIHVYSGAVAPAFFVSVSLACYLFGGGGRLDAGSYFLFFSAFRTLMLEA